MKRILITGAGGSASTNFVRSLRLAPEKFHLIGVDHNRYCLQRAETDEKYLCPSAEDYEYIPYLNNLTQKTKAQFIHAQNDAEVYAISRKRDKLKIKTFLPPHSTIKMCQNKYTSACMWELTGFRKPKTYLIRNEMDLISAFGQIEGELWIRDIKGAGGKGSLKTDDFITATRWIDLKKGWGNYTAAEYLSPHSTTWSSIWQESQLIVGQGRRRLYWELNGLSMTGVTGATGTGVTEDNPTTTKIAIQAIKAIDLKPHGIYSVDMTYGQDNIPYPTEINIGRFFTTHYFFAKAGLNLAYIYVKLAFGEEISIPKNINPLPNDLAWIRGMDFEPILTTLKEIDKYKI